MLRNTSVPSKRSNKKETGYQASLVSRVNRALNTFFRAELHGALRALFEHKVNLLIQDCTVLASDEYRTSDEREAIFLFSDLYHSSLYPEVAIIVQPYRSLGSFPQQGSYEKNLIDLASGFTTKGKQVRMVFVVDDWIQVPAEVDSTSLIRDLLLHKIEVSFAPKAH